MSLRLRRVVAGAALVVGIGIGQQREAMPAVAQDDGDTSTTIDLSPFDDPFSFANGYYLIHLLGTNTMDGYVAKDVYILNAEAPKDGWFLTADGMGGTFNNKGDSVGGPFTTPRAVCGAAKGLPQQTFGIEDRYWDCAQLGSTSKGGGGIGLAGLVGALAAGAAVAGGVALTWNRIRNRRRPDWIPTDPGSGLTPECFTALTGLRAEVDGVLAKLSDLLLARDGAIRQAAVANTDAAVLDSLARPPVAAAATTGAVSSAAGTAGLAVDSAGVATSTVQGSSKLATMLADAERSIAHGQDLRSVVARVRSMMQAEMMTKGSTLLDDATLAAYGTTADELSAAGTATVKMAEALKAFGRGLGVASIVAGAISMASGAAHFGDMELVGQWRMEADLRRAETGRWMSLAGDMSKRMQDLEKDFLTKVAAYNARALVCKADPLRPPAWPRLVDEFGAETLAVGSNAPINEAIQNIFPQGPQPIKHDERIDNCDRNAYDELLRDFGRAVADRDDAWSEARKWRQREADADATIDALESARDKAQAYIDERETWWGAMGAVGTAATVATFVVGPAAAIALGAVSITSSIVGGAAAPADPHVMDLGKVKAVCTQMQPVRRAIGVESTRCFNRASACSANVADRHTQLVMMHGRCSAGAAAPWPAPPPLPSPPEYHARVEGAVRSYWEILRWH